MADLNEVEAEESSSAPKKKKTAPKEKKGNFFTRTGAKIKKFFADYISEMKKVVWLSRKETVRSSLVVLVLVLVVGVLIGLLDSGLGAGVNGLRTLFTNNSWTVA